MPTGKDNPRSPLVKTSLRQVTLMILDDSETFLPCRGLNGGSADLSGADFRVSDRDFRFPLRTAEGPTERARGNRQWLSDEYAKFLRLVLDHADLYSLRTPSPQLARVPHFQNLPYGALTARPKPKSGLPATPPARISDKGVRSGTKAERHGTNPVRRSARQVRLCAKYVRISCKPLRV